jgi:enoyl-[acyl-carrier-protein] reductase (NADH)
MVYTSGNPASKKYFDDRLAATTGRWVEAGEIGDVVAFLCSPQGSAVNGMAIPVDNGLHLFGA